MAQDLKPGQFWRDTVIGDVLKVLEISAYAPESTLRKVTINPDKCIECGKLDIEHTADGRCEPDCPHGSSDVATCNKCKRFSHEKSTLSYGQGDPVRYVRCACYPRGEYYLGIQEMKAAHLNGDRFQLIKMGWIKSLWYRWKFRKP